MSNQDIEKWAGLQLVTNNGRIQKRDILLVVLLIDDSGSIATSHNTKAVIAGFNGFRKALLNAPGEVRLKTMFLNNTTADTSFLDPKEVQELTRLTYRPNGNTPLFLRSVEALACVIKEAKKLTQQGRTVRTMTFIFTDGCDNESGSTTAANVKVVVDVLLTTDTHIVGGCAVSDGATNFSKVFVSMGIPENWIRILKNDSGEVENTVIDLGAMAAEASTSRDIFYETSQTGFVGRKAK